MNSILNLAPQNVWKHFYELTQVPRPSGHLEQIQKFLLDYGKKIHVTSFKDDAGNVVYKKPAYPGMENRKAVILQAHMDMVPQKNKEKEVDWRGNADNFPDMFHRRRPINDCSMPRCLLRVVDAASLRENAPSEDQRGILHAVVVQVHSKQAVHLAKFFYLFQ